MEESEQGNYKETREKIIQDKEGRKKGTRQNNAMKVAGNLPRNYARKVARNWEVKYSTQTAEVSKELCDKSSKPPGRKVWKESTGNQAEMYAREVAGK